MRGNVNKCTNSKTKIKRVPYVPYSQIRNLKKIDSGGFATIYKATWKNKKVALKRFSNPKDFKNELRSHCECCKCGCINRCYGMTKDPKTKSYMLILQFAKGGNLHKYLQKNFAEIKWSKKIEIMYQISEGLKKFHDINYTHRDLHSGNILYLDPNPQYHIKKWWQIGDLGMAQPENIHTDEIYGVMPYVAPERFKGWKYSKASDIYSFGMLMWEFAAGCRPFDNVGHDTYLILDIVDGKRPKITEDTPECIAELIKKCWNSNPMERPSIDEINRTLSNAKDNEFYDADQKRLELIRLERLGPKFSKKSHSEAIYTSRLLSKYISEEVTKFEYITKELWFDI